MEKINSCDKNFHLMYQQIMKKIFVDSRSEQFSNILPKNLIMNDIERKLYILYGVSIRNFLKHIKLKAVRTKLGIEERKVDFYFYCCGVNLELIEFTFRNLIIPYAYQIVFSTIRTWKSQLKLCNALLTESNFKFIIKFPCNMYAEKSSKNFYIYRYHKSIGCIKDL